MKILNPSTQDIITNIVEDQSKEVKEKYQRTRDAQASWSAIDLNKRIECIQRFYSLLEKNKDELAHTLTQEVGKPLQEALNEIEGARGRIKYFIENSSKWLSTQEMNRDGSTIDILAFDPLGVVCNISAWNYPFLVGVNVFIPALIAGNSVLYKPSEFATLTGLNIERLLHESGVPADNFVAVVGGGTTGDLLLDLPCDGYFFTGSHKTGKYIVERVAPRLIPVGLELGGKDPLYVTDEVEDIEKVAASVAEGVFYNNGQSCCSVERVYVHADVYDNFMKAFISEVTKLNPGDPFNKENQQGAITRSSHLDFLESQVDDALKKGAKLICGGKRLGNANFFPPTVLENVNHSMKLMMEETFGPLIGVMKVSDDSEAIRLMNDTEYGLTAAVFSSNTERAKKILSSVEAGTAYVNCCDRVSPYLPWSGRKSSGLGSTLSYLGIQTFTKPRGWHVRVG
jgi:acyl-CoA reductase-like NAD-dependent aldehyde dehydrogenase